MGEAAQRLGQPPGHLRGDTRQLPALSGAQRAPDLLERGAGLFRSQPGERPDHLSRPSAAQHKLPRRRAAQSNFLATECQGPARSGCQILGSERNLRRQTERIGRRGAAAGDALTALCRKRLDRLVGRRCPVCRSGSRLAAHRDRGPPAVVHHGEQDATGPDRLRRGSQGGATPWPSTGRLRADFAHVAGLIPSAVPRETPPIRQKYYPNSDDLQGDRASRPPLWRMAATERSLSASAFARSFAAFDPVQECSTYEPVDRTEPLILSPTRGH